MLKPGSSSSQRKLHKEREKVWDEGAFVWKVCNPPVRNDYCCHLYISYRVEADGAFVMALSQELAKRELIHYPGLKISAYLDGEGTRGGAPSTIPPEALLSRSCLFMPVLSEAAVRPWLMAGFTSKSDTLFLRICTAMQYSKEGAIDILPLLVGSVEETGSSARRTRVCRFSGIRGPLWASDALMLPEPEQEHSPHQILYDLCRFRGLHSSPKSVKGTANIIADIFSKQTWPRFCSQWEDQDAVQKAMALQHKAAAAVVDITDEEGTPFPRQLRVGTLEGGGTVVLLFLSGLGLMILSLAAATDDEDGDCKAAESAQLLCRLSWTSAVCAVGFGCCFSTALRERRLGRIRAQMRKREEAAAEPQPDGGRAEEDSAASENGSGGSSLLSEEDPSVGSTDARPPPWLDGVAWKEEGCYADAPPEDFVALPAAAALTLNGSIIAVASPLDQKFYSEWTVLLLFWFLGILSLVAGLVWTAYLLRAFFIAKSRRPFLRFHDFPFYTGGEIRACCECPEALKVFRKFSVTLLCVREMVSPLPGSGAEALSEEETVGGREQPQMRFARLYSARAVARQRRFSKKTRDREGNDREGESTPLLEEYMEDEAGLTVATENSIWLLHKERPGTPRVNSMQNGNSHEGKAFCTGSGIEIFFALPSNTRPTSLAKHPAIYWEVEVEGLEPMNSPTTKEQCCQGGRFFFARFIVPVFDHPLGFSS